MLLLDHIAIAATDLQDGAGWLSDLLGVGLESGGQHAAMGTHNRLLGLGDLYLEVIAIDPLAPAPERARWFGLDQFTGPPRLTNWIARCDDLPAALRAAPKGAGTPMDLARGDLRWQMAVPETGVLPFDGIYPALISWQGAGHPTQLLPDAGVRLERLEVRHPNAGALSEALGGQLTDPRVSVAQGDAPELRACLTTPRGTVVLS